MAEDYRKRCTQKIVKDAMIELLEEKPLHKIKVTELCEKAGINRATFYNNFEDIYDLYENIENEYFENFYQMISSDDLLVSSFKVQKIIVKHVECILENKKLFMIFYRSERCFRLFEKVMQRVTDWVSELPSFNDWIKDENIAFNSKEELQMMNIFMIHGISGLLYTKLASGEEVVPNDFVKLVLQFLYERMIVPK